MFPGMQGPPMPPELQPSMDAGPAAAQSLMGGGIPMGDPMGGQPLPDDGGMRSALAYIEAATELLTAASNSMPMLQPFVERAMEMVMVGMDTIQSGGGMPVGPPTQAGPPMGPGGGMPIPGGSVPGGGPENIPMGF